MLPAGLRAAVLPHQRALALATGGVSHLVASGPADPVWLTCVVADPTVPPAAHRAALTAAPTAPPSGVTALELPGLTALAVRLIPLTTLTLVTPTASASETRTHAHALWRAAVETGTRTS
ncbi:hypothetical protein [Streptomyces sp. 4F14]|uniref:hypothetical protein n=1 Tax=Streptomyces sp. 4F14 TaxID=3394380 RepID=UPI003A86BF97